MQCIAAIQGYLVILIDELCRTFISQTNVRWDRLVLVAWLIHLFSEFLEQFYLGVSFLQLLGIGICVGNSSCSIELHLYHLVALLVAFQLVFGSAQFRVDLLQTVVDKLFCTIGYFVLVEVSLVGYIP